MSTERLKERVLKANNKGLFTPINYTETVHIPGANGGALFGGTAAEPRTGAVYVITQDNPGLLRLLKPGESARGGGPPAMPGQASVRAALPGLPRRRSVGNRRRRTAGSCGRRSAQQHRDWPAALRRRPRSGQSCKPGRTACPPFRSSRRLTSICSRQLVQHGVDAFVFVGLDHDPAPVLAARGLRPPVRAHLGHRSPSTAIPASASTTRQPPPSSPGTCCPWDIPRFGLISAPVSRQRPGARAGCGRAAGAGRGGPGIARAQRAVRADLAASPPSRRCIDSSRCRDPPAAIVATNDVFAVGAMIACRRARRADSGGRVDHRRGQHRSRRDADAGPHQHPHADRRDRACRRCADHRPSRRARVGAVPGFSGGHRPPGQHGATAGTAHTADHPMIQR